MSSIFKFRVGTFVVVIALLTGHCQSVRAQSNQPINVSNAEDSSTNESRIWTDASGTFQTEAVLVEVKDGLVAILRKGTETPIQVPLKQLSKKDQEYVTSYLKANKTPATKTPAIEKIPVGFRLGEIAPEDLSDLAIPEVSDEEIESVDADYRDAARDLTSRDDYPLIRRRLKEFAAIDPPIRDLTISKLLAGHTLSKDKFCRQSAVEALARMAPRRGLLYIAGRLKDSSHDVRWTTYEIIMNLGDPDFIEPVSNCLGKYEQAKVSSLLVSFGNQAEPYLYKHLNDKSVDVRKIASSILGQIGTENSIPVLQKVVANDTNSIVRLQAKSSISKIQQRQ